jgi:hypothetical protein
MFKRILVIIVLNVVPDVLLHSNAKAKKSAQLTCTQTARTKQSSHTPPPTTILSMEIWQITYGAQAMHTKTVQSKLTEVKRTSSIYFQVLPKKKEWKGAVKISRATAEGEVLKQECHPLRCDVRFRWSISELSRWTRTTWGSTKMSNVKLKGWKIRVLASATRKLL